MTILKPFDFSDVDSKDAVSGSDYRWYKPFYTSGTLIDATKDSILTGATSGVKIKILKDSEVGDFEVYAKIVTGSVDEEGEDFINSETDTVFTSESSVNSGENIYLIMGDEYYLNLLRDYGIDQDDSNLIAPIFKVKKVLICFIEREIFADLIRDSRAPFNGQEILADKYKIKLDEAQACFDRWINELDKNAFFGTSKSADTKIVARYGRC